MLSQRNIIFHNISGVSIQAWEGGNMPATEENVYSYVHKKSSWTMLAFTILTFAVTWGLSAGLTSVIGTGLGALYQTRLLPLSAQASTQA